MKYDINHIKSGIWAGIIAGVVFGAMMGMMGMLPMVAKLFGGEAAFLGFVIHIVFSAIIGGFFGLFLGHTALEKGIGILLGLVYGLVWWVLGPLIIMPVWLGMGVQLSVAGAQMSLPSLWGHLVYGFILGLVYALMTSKVKES